MSRWAVARDLGPPETVDPWGDAAGARLISLMWSALPHPDAFADQLPARPPERADPWTKSIWWTPLVHLSRFGLGLLHPGASVPSLMRSTGGNEATERARRLIELWWGAGVDEFAAWGILGGDHWLRTGGPWPLEVADDRPTDRPEDLDDLVHRVQETSAWRATWTGGGDPLHLADHCAHPLSPEAPVHLSASGERLVLRSLGYAGWYHALRQLVPLAEPGGTRVTVEIHGFGELGTYALAAGHLPRLVSVPTLRRPERSLPGVRGEGTSAPDRARASTMPTTPTDAPTLLGVVLRRCVEHLRQKPGTRFVLDVPTWHDGDGVYTQALGHDDGNIYAEVPGSAFLDPPLDAGQLEQLHALGWSPPDEDTPNHWQHWPAHVAAAGIAETLRFTLKAVYGATSGQFSLAPAALAARVVPDHVTLSIGNNDHFRSWLATIERAGAPSPTSAALSVARCLEVDAARTQSGHPCRKIVNLQPAAPNRFQVPEAWAGNLEAGRIVFLSSNPSISEAGDHQSGDVAELYPTADWADEDIADFVRRRFDSPKGWATEDGRFRRKDGTLSPKPVAFWNNIRHRAEELLEHPASPAHDYAMTEVVHCKSKAEAGVAQAALTCADRHLDSILSLSPANLVVVLGQRSRTLLSGIWPLGPAFGLQKGEHWREGDNMALVNVGGRQRLVVYLWHPTGSTAPKTFAGAYPTHLRGLRALLRGEIGPDEAITLYG